MALVDYWLCDICECKTFYDAQLDYDRHNPTRHDGRMIPAGAGDMRVICPKCAETYVIEVRQRAAEAGERSNRGILAMAKPILCLDFDGVIHSYSSGWKGADTIPDPPVAGAMKFIWDATEHFRVAVFSSRSNQPGGLSAMKAWLCHHFKDFWGTHATQADDKLSDIEWPLEKPAAMVTIDDRALTFDGTWPQIEDLKAFQPWNKRPFGATGDFPQRQLNDDDQGGIKIGVAYDKLDGIVRVAFGKPVAWLGLPPPEAIELAKLLMRHAGAKKIEVTL